MKKILIGVSLGLLVSVGLFVWGWQGMEKRYSLPKNLADERYCKQLDICLKCERKYDCLKKECASNQSILSSCQNIEENFKRASLEMSSENFVLSLCGQNNDFFNTHCLAKEKDDFKLKLTLALDQVSYNTGIGNFFILSHFYNFGVIAWFVLFIPIILGFLVGLAFYVFQNKK